MAHLAPPIGHTKIVHLLLEGGANENAWFKGLKGWSSLHLVSFLGETDIGRLVLKGGANANVQDKERHHSTWNQRRETIMSREGVEETWYIENYRVRQILRVVSDNCHGIVGMWTPPSQALQAV